ncbi:hypothetical protein FBU30_006238 [Linnemannia zychae]|nr:hypothetical protein FBU30_006238 [Linnemannia zychae]
MRRLVLDVWWDSAGLGWQLCPRLKRNPGQLSGVRLALEQEQERIRLSSGLNGANGMLQLQDTSNITPTTADKGVAAEEGQIRQKQPSSQQDSHTPIPPQPSNLLSTLLSALPKEPNMEEGPATHLHKRASSSTFAKTKTSTGISPLVTSGHNSDTIRSNQSNRINGTLEEPKGELKNSRTKGKLKHNKSSFDPNTLPLAADITKLPNGKLSSVPTSHNTSSHRMTMNKGTITPNDILDVADQTVDGITCSTGEDLSILLQSLHDWLQRTAADELEDVLLIILNLNELGTNNPGLSNPPPTTPSQSPAPGPTNSPTPSSVSDAEFFGQFTSPNTNKIISDAAVRTVSLKDLFMNELPSSLYTPTLLELERSDLDMFWWKDGPVGLDYYNVSSNPETGKKEAPTGWPTSVYLRNKVNRRVVVGIGANNLAANTTGSRPINGQQQSSPDDIHAESGLVLPTYARQGRSQQLTFSEQTAMTIWSWDIGQPPEDLMRSRNRRCGAMKSNGRWVVQDCNDKLPVACRKIGTSSQWIIYDKGAGNYRDVTCPEGYKFDVPRTGRENQMLFSTLRAYRNSTAPTFFQQLSSFLPGSSKTYIEPPIGHLSDPATGGSIKRHKKREEKAENVRSHHFTRYEDNDDDDGDGDDNDDDVYDDDDNSNKRNTGRNNPNIPSLSKEARAKDGTGANPKETKAVPIRAVAPDTDDGVVWIDISSWQTAGCWVPGGVDGTCPYRAPDNTVALQEIVKVSTIGGVIILVLVGIFLYMKCRRNVRLRKESKRRAQVREKILLTEVETVPA